MNTTNDTAAFELTELIETVARLLFVTRTGELPSAWHRAPLSTRARYIDEAEALDAAGVLNSRG